MTALASWHTDFPGMLAGSVYAAPGSRLFAAQTLVEEGLDVHIDVMAASEGLPVGVSLAELQMISAAVDRHRVGVHVIGSGDFVDAVLPKILALHPGVVFLPWRTFTADRVVAVRAAGGKAWIALWREWDGLDPEAPPWRATPDGLLVMLIEPGSRDRSVIRRLDVVTACAGYLPVAVDGGVTESVAERSVTAGARSIVVGRALLGDTSEIPDLFAISNEGTP
jgi:hypothetical protein